MNSVLAIGGVGGLAIGLAGREILENLFTGLIILSSSPFEVGEEVLFTPPSGPVRRCDVTLRWPYFLQHDQLQEKDTLHLPWCAQCQNGSIVEPDCTHTCRLSTPMLLRLPLLSPLYPDLSLNIWFCAVNCIWQHGLSGRRRWRA